MGKQPIISGNNTPANNDNNNWHNKNSKYNMKNDNATTSPSGS